MIDMDTLALFKDRYKYHTADGKGDDSPSGRALTLGLVVNSDDPLEQGRLQIFCPALNDNPKKIQHLPWCAYITPFGGSINNSSYTRGTGDGEATSEGAIHYGFWAVPELGAHVLVGCIDGDPRRRFWVGCLPEHQETHTQFNGRFDWNAKKGTPDGPLTSSKKPIQPIYDNWTQAFVDRESREWKTRGADYQATAVTKAGNGAPSKVRGDDYLDDTYEGMSKNEKDKWVRDVMGAHGYDWSGFKGAGAFKSSRVFGLSSPGFHSISMDDRPFNLRTKIRSATGHMILMDDTNERIYVMTNKGNSWLEMDSNGNIDMFSDRRVSINASSDINFTTGGTFRVHADGGIHMYAGHSTDEQRGSLTVPPNRGEFRIQSEDDVHILGKNLRNRSMENTYNETGINRYESVGDSSFLDVQKDINVRTILGDYIKSIANDLHETVMVNSKRLSYGTNALSSNGDNEVFSFSGGLAIGSQSSVSVKSAAGDVDLEAQGLEGGTGNVNTKTPKSQVSVGDKGVESKTDMSITQKATVEISQEIKTPASGVAGGTVIKLGASGVDIQAMSNINFKSMGGMASNTHANITQTLNSTTTGLNMLTYYTYALQLAVSAIADAADTSFSLPFSFDVSGITADVFAGAMPAGLTSVYSSIEALSATATSLAIPGVTLPVTLESVVGDLSGNATALSALGLPTDLTFPINPSVLGGIDILQYLNLSVDVMDVLTLLLPKFRPTVDSIFANISSSSPPPMPTTREPLGAITTTGLE